MQDSFYVKEDFYKILHYAELFGQELCRNIGFMVLSAVISTEKPLENVAKMPNL